MLVVSYTALYWPAARELYFFVVVHMEPLRKNNDKRSKNDQNPNTGTKQQDPYYTHP